MFFHVDRVEDLPNDRLGINATRDKLEIGNFISGRFSRNIKRYKSERLIPINFINYRNLYLICNERVHLIFTFDIRFSVRRILGEKNLEIRD